MTFNVQINIVKCNNVVKVVVFYIVLLKSGQQKLKENSFPLLAILESSVQFSSSSLPIKPPPMALMNSFPLLAILESLVRFSSVQAISLESLLKVKKSVMKWRVQYS